MEEIFKTWFKPLNYILNTEYFNKLVQYLTVQYDLSKFAFNKIKIYPNKRNVFKCFGCDFNHLKVVFIGSKPFDHFAGGLAFDSCDGEIRTHNIADVIRSKIEREFHGDLKLDYDYTLEDLMDQGVLLLNESLTSCTNKDHKELWKDFIANVIDVIQTTHTGIIFCIQEDSDLVNHIDVKTQYVLTYPDPAKYVNDMNSWDFSFKLINDILENNNGPEYKIEF
jgi:uracil DNA glycosylase